MYRFLSLLAAGVFFVVSGISPAYAMPNRFPDVPTSHPNYEAIEDLASRGIINGYTDGTFRPGNTVTRTEVLKILLLGAGIGVDGSKSDEASEFPDVERGKWYVPFVKVAKTEGIIRGYEDGLFRPHKTVNRIEALKMLLLSFGQDPSSNQVLEPPYTDVPMGLWYTPFAQYARKQALVDPDGQNKFHTTTGMTRGDLAEMTFRLLRRLNR